MPLGASNWLESDRFFSWLLHPQYCYHLRLRRKNLHVQQSQTNPPSLWLIWLFCSKQLPIPQNPFLRHQLYVIFWIILPFTPNYHPLVVMNADNVFKPGRFLSSVIELVRRPFFWPHLSHWHGKSMKVSNSDFPMANLNSKLTGNFALPRLMVHYSVHVIKRYDPGSEVNFWIHCEVEPSSIAYTRIQ